MVEPTPLTRSWGSNHHLVIWFKVYSSWKVDSAQVSYILIYCRTLLHPPTFWYRQAIYFDLKVVLFPNPLKKRKAAYIFSPNHTKPWSWSSTIPGQRYNMNTNSRGMVPSRSIPGTKPRKRWRQWEVRPFKSLDSGNAVFVCLYHLKSRRRFHPPKGGDLDTGAIDKPRPTWELSHRSFPGGVCANPKKKTKNKHQRK